MVRLIILAFLTSLMVLPAMAAPPSTCGQSDDYSRALCAYQRRNFIEAETILRQLSASEDRSATTIRATYFLARTLMKLGKFDEASTLLVRIYALDRAFYDTWSCDFLLGECRKAIGKG